MFKVIVKTALKTLLAAIIILVLAFAGLSLGYPSGMASFFERCGWYSFAKGYASLSYTYSGNIEDLARCFNDGVMANDDGSTVKFGGELIEKDGFDGLCERETERLGINYRHFVYGNVSCAKYRRGDKNGALDTAVKAFADKNSFPVNNALTQLAGTARGDATTLKLIKAEMESITPLESEKDYYDRVLDSVTQSLNTENT